MSRIVLLACLSFVLSGCGASVHLTVPRTNPLTNAPATTPTPPPAPTPGPDSDGIVAESRVDDLLDHLGDVRAVQRLTAAGDLPHRARGDVVGNDIRAVLTHGPRRREVRLVDGVAYLRANRAWWQSKAWAVPHGRGPALVHSEAGRWLRVTKGCRCLVQDIASLSPAFYRSRIALLQSLVPQVDPAHPAFSLLTGTDDTGIETFRYPNTGRSFPLDVLVSGSGMHLAVRFTALAHPTPIRAPRGARPTSTAAALAIVATAAPL